MSILRRPASRTGGPPVRGFGLIAVGLVLVAGMPGRPVAHVLRDVPDYRYSPAQTEAVDDRDMIIRVHLACLWEVTAGALAQQRANSPAVKAGGTTIHDDDTQLDREARGIASQLDLVLPDQPNDQQQGWLNQLSGNSGNNFDTLFASLLRQAQGSIFTNIAAVRASTEDGAVRQFSDNAVTVFMKHMRLLEGTNLVDYAALAPAPHPALTRVPFSKRPFPDVLFVWLVVAVALLGGALSATRIIRPQ
jgi:predicted outer membrane protein